MHSIQKSMEVDIVLQISALTEASQRILGTAGNTDTQQRSF